MSRTSKIGVGIISLAGAMILLAFNLYIIGGANGGELLPADLLMVNGWSLLIPGFVMFFAGLEYP